VKMKTKVTESSRSRVLEEELEQDVIPEHLSTAIPVLQVPSTLPSFSFKPAHPVSTAPPTSAPSSSASTPITFSFNKPVNPAEDKVKSTAGLEKGSVQDKVSSQVVTSGKTILNVFNFRVPECIRTKQSVGCVSTHYAFSPPASVKSMLAPRNLVGNFKSAAMPDVTYNFKTKSGDVIQGVEKGGLPDITASTGFAPAKSLKMGSVMDILGKKC
jgi:hypothetical protein